MSCPVGVTATFQKQAYGVEVTFSLQLYFVLYYYHISSIIKAFYDFSY